MCEGARVVEIDRRAPAHPIETLRWSTVLGGVLGRAGKGDWLRMGASATGEHSKDARHYDDSKNSQLNARLVAGSGARHKAGKLSGHLHSRGRLYHSISPLFQHRA